MALTRKFLEALQVPETAVQAIIDEHTATIGNIKAELTTATQERDKAKEDLENVQKDLNVLKGGDWEKKYNDEHKTLEALKADINAKETKAKKTAAIKAYYEGKKVKGSNLNIALRGTDFETIELDDEGKIKDTKALDELLEGDFKGLIENTNRVIDTAARVGNNEGGVVDYNLKNALKEAYKKD